MTLISRLGGWAKLARAYRFDGDFRGKIWRFESVKMRMGAGYNNCVNIGTNEQGLYLSVFFLCRPGHPSLFIRWSEITVQEKKRWRISRFEFRFQRADSIPVSIGHRLGQQIVEEAGEQWAGKNPLLYSSD